MSTSIARECWAMSSCAAHHMPAYEGEIDPGLELASYLLIEGP